MPFYLNLLQTQILGVGFAHEWLKMPCGLIVSWCLFRLLDSLGGRRFSGAVAD